MAEPLITKPGAYPGIDITDYHRNPNLLPGPSLSGSGAKTILSKSPFHFWWDSTLNPNRPPEPDRDHFNVGKAAHDLILLADRFADSYHVTPEGFSRAKSKQLEAEIAAADAAIKAGKTILSYDQHQTVLRAAEAISRNDLALATLTNGVTEETLCWQDEETGVWLRARPDFRPHSIVEKRDVMVVPDLKFVSPEHASPEGFGKAIFKFGYHQAAAFYCDAIKAIYGHAPTHWLHVVVEKPAVGIKPEHSPFTVSLYQLPEEDIKLGRKMNRHAIDIFAKCLRTGEWPSYADAPRRVGMPVWAKMRIEEYDPVALAFARSE